MPRVQKGTSSTQDKKDKDLISELERFATIVLEGDDDLETSEMSSCGSGES